MTSEEKIKLRKMRFDGESYTKIAAVIGVSANTIKSFCRRNNLQNIESENNEPKNTCKNCNKKLTVSEKQKPKIFCCDNCRFMWWKNNRDKMQKKAIYLIECKNCKKIFESYGNNKRVFCEHSCYVACRFSNLKMEAVNFD